MMCLELFEVRFFLANHQTMTDPEHLLLVVDTGSEEHELHTPGRSVRMTKPGIERSSRASDAHTWTSPISSLRQVPTA